MLDRQGCDYIACGGIRRFAKRKMVDIAHKM